MNQTSLNISLSRSEGKYVFAIRNGREVGTRVIQFGTITRFKEPYRIVKQFIT